MTQTGIVKGNRDKLADIRVQLEQSQKSFAAIMPRGMDAQRFVRIVVSACSRTPELLQCSARSIILACAQSAALGLEPNTPLGQAYLVPFKGECTLIPSYRGLTQLAYQSGHVKSLQARAVHAGDTFDVDYGTDPKIVHRPCLGNPGELIGVYAVAQLTSGGFAFDFMSIHEVKRIRDMSKAGKSGPWVDHFEEMAKKTIIRRLSKALPMSEEKFAKALELHAASEAGEAPDFSEVAEVIGETVDPDTGEVSTPKNGGSRTDKLKAELAASQREPGSDG